MLLRAMLTRSRTGPAAGAAVPTHTARKVRRSTSPVVATSASWPAARSRSTTRRLRKAGAEPARTASRTAVAVVSSTAGGAMARSAGTYAQIVARDQGYVTVRLNSGEQRLVHGQCFATVGAVSNPDHMNISIGKAGRNRWLGKKPHVRGVAMNPVDHPLGGGEGRTSGGRHPVTPWGVPTKGYKTRSNKKLSNQFIVQRRKK